MTDEIILNKLLGWHWQKDEESNSIWNNKKNFWNTVIEIITHAWIMPGNSFILPVNLVFSVEIF